MMQIVEVERAEASQLRRIGGHDGERLGEDRAVEAREGWDARRLSPVLQPVVAKERHRLVQRHQHLWVPHPGDLAERRPRARGVEDREAARQVGDGAGILGEQPRHAGVEGADPDGRTAAQLRRHTRAHFGCRAVGEGDAEQALGRFAVPEDEVDRPARQRFRLARARPGENELRRAGRDRRGLLLVQAFEMIRHGGVGITMRVIRTLGDSDLRRRWPLAAAGSPRAPAVAPDPPRPRWNGGPGTP